MSHLVVSLKRQNWVQQQQQSGGQCGFYCAEDSSIVLLTGTSAVRPLPLHHHYENNHRLSRLLQLYCAAANKPILVYHRTKAPSCRIIVNKGLSQRFSVSCLFSSFAFHLTSLSLSSHFSVEPATRQFLIGDSLESGRRRVRGLSGIQITKNAYKLEFGRGTFSYR